MIESERLKLRSQMDQLEAGVDTWFVELALKNRHRLDRIIAKQQPLSAIGVEEFREPIPLDDEDLAIAAECVRLIRDAGQLMQARSLLGMNDATK